MNILRTITLTTLKVTEILKVCTLKVTYVTCIEVICIEITPITGTIKSFVTFQMTSMLSETLTRKSARTLLSAVYCTMCCHSTISYSNINEQMRIMFFNMHPKWNSNSSQELTKNYELSQFIKIPWNFTGIRRIIKQSAKLKSKFLISFVGTNLTNL